MTLKVKLLLIGLAFLGLGSFTVHYQLYRSQVGLRLQQMTQAEQRSAEWVAEILEHRVEQMEAAVSYLDKSTVESLRRLGVRYFVYAHRQGAEWRLKWKLIDDLSESDLLAEVNQIDFDQLKVDQRSWQQPKAERLVLVTPVSLAASLQLKEGFLVFGLKDQFFEFIRERDGLAQVYSRDAFPLYRVSGQLPLPKAWLTSLFSEPSTKTQFQEEHALTAFLSAKTEAWVIRPVPFEQRSFLADAQGRYFLVGTLFLMGLFVLLLWLIPQGEWSFAPFANLQNHLQTVRQLRPRRDQIRQNFEDEILPAHGLSEVDEVAVAFDLGELLQGLVTDEGERLRAIGIELKTQFPEHVEVMGSALHLRDFLHRLIGNSALTLSDESEKRIELQLIEQSTGFQLIYLDSRSKHFPDAEGASLLLQTEGSLTGIDGIIAYASWYFGDNLHVARKGFCLSLDLPRGGEDLASVLTPPNIGIKAEVAEDHFSQFNLSDLNFLDTQMANASASGQDLTEQFTNLNLEVETSNRTVAPEPQDQEINGPTADRKGLFEFSSGDFKIKIRAPRKKDKDVNY